MDNKLESLIKEYFTQDNRGTSYPVYFTIMAITPAEATGFFDGEGLDK